ncbi:MAG TPA: ABC transporter permease [Candidatus Binatia bacterium]|nr:ABC transporter permease [Candidatus Binatia bacterium]
MIARLRAMVRKEFSQLLRDVPMLLILAWAFTGAVYVNSQRMSSELQNYPVVVLDLAGSPSSRELVARFRAPYFKVVGYAAGDDELVRMLDTGAASLAIVVPPDFERRARDSTARLQVISDGSQSMIATIAGAHVASIANGYSVELLERRWAGAVGLRRTGIPQVETRTRVEYNPNLVNTWFSALLEVLNQTTMATMLLSAAAMVREREYGTIEHLLVSPLRPVELLAAKIAPVVTLVPLAALASVLVMVHGLFGTPIRGSLVLFYAVTVVHVFAMASLGLGIAVLARNLGQAIMMLLLILYPMQILSGAFTPPESQGAFMRTVGQLSPLRHYVDFGYQVLFKGNGLAYVWQDVAGILALGLALFTLSVRRFARLVR